MNPAPFGSRKVELTSMARNRMTPDEKAEVYATARDRGLRVALMYSVKKRAYSCVIVAGGEVYEGVANTPTEAWRRALALRYPEPLEIVSLLDA